MTYLYIKAIHIVFVMSWFAGLMYIVRLFIYHTEALAKAEPEKSILSNQLRIMTKRLWFIITWPSAILTLIFGSLLLWQQPEFLKMPFMHLKLTFVFLLYVYHLLCHRLYVMLGKGIARFSSTQLRMWNEIATLIAVGIVFLIVVKSGISWVWGTVGLILLGIIMMLIVKIYKKWRKEA